MLLFVVLGCSGGTDAAETDTDAATTGDTGTGGQNVNLTADGAPADLQSFQVVFRREASAACRAAAGGATTDDGTYPDDGCYNPLKYDSCAEQIADLAPLKLAAVGCEYDVAMGAACLNAINDPGFCRDDGTGWIADDTCERVCLSP